MAGASIPVNLAVRGTGIVKSANSKLHDFSSQPKSKSRGTDQFKFRLETEIVQFRRPISDLPTGVFLASRIPLGIHGCCGNCGVISFLPEVHHEFSKLSLLRVVRSGSGCGFLGQRVRQ
jgi:hypothetical protein